MKKKVHFTYSYFLNPTHPLTVGLIGVGGTGSQVLSSLARINHALNSMGHPGLFVYAYDPDEVTESNIGRQMFCESDIGQNKADVLITRINRFYGTAWESIPHVYEQNLSNIYITCVDNIKSRLELASTIRNRNKYVTEYKKGKYWLDFGNAQNHGQFVLGTIGKIEQPSSKMFKTVGKLKTVTELFDFSKVEEKDSGPSCSLAEALSKQNLFINSTLAQAGCSILWKLITEGIIEYQGAFLNLETMQVNPINL